MTAFLYILSLFVLGCKVERPELNQAEKYQVIGEHKIRLTIENRQAHMWTVLSTAASHEAYAQTVMQAAYDLHLDNPAIDLVQVMLVPDSLFLNTGACYAFVWLATDKNGVRGVPGADHQAIGQFTWMVRAANRSLSAEELAIARLWYQYQHDFPQQDMLSSLSYDAHALKSFIADSLDLNIAEVSLPLLPLSDYLLE